MLPLAGGETNSGRKRCWRFRARNKAKSRLPIFFICDPIQNHGILVGANGCSPEEVNRELHLTAINVQRKAGPVS
jgi:hypothetical protein